MTEAKPQPAIFKCPECGKEFTNATGLGSHRRTHGIRGSSSQTLNYHKNKNREKFSNKNKLGRPTGSKNKTTTRSIQLAHAAQTQNGHHSHAINPNGHHSLSHEALKAACAVAYGRTLEIIAGLSRELDLSPRLVARELAILIAREGA